MSLLAVVKRVLAARNRIEEAQPVAPVRPLRFMDPAVVQMAAQFGRMMGDTDRRTGHSSLGQAISAFARGYESAFEDPETSPS